METSIEVNRHVDDAPERARETAPTDREPDARRRPRGRGPERREGDRVSVDPMRSTDRYRLVLPGVDLP